MVLNPSPTRDRLRHWGIKVIPHVFYPFFDCNFSSAIWAQLSSRCNFTYSRNWDSILQQLKAFTTPSLADDDLCNVARKEPETTHKLVKVVGFIFQSSWSNHSEANLQFPKFKSPTSLRDDAHVFRSELRWLPSFISICLISFWANVGLHYSDSIRSTMFVAT